MRVGSLLAEALALPGGGRIEDGLHVAGGARIEGATHLAGDFQADGSALVSGGLVTGGDVRFNAQAHIGGHANIQGDAAVAGQASVAGQLNVAGSMHGQYLKLAGVARFSAACGEEGLIANSDRGGLLVCRSGHWRGAEGGFGGAYAKNSIYGCVSPYGESTANPFTGDCSCPPGYVAVNNSYGNDVAHQWGLTMGYVCMAPP